MKYYRKDSKKLKTRQKSKDTTSEVPVNEHEQRAIDDIFVETSDPHFSIDVEDDPKIDVFEAVDYGLVKDETLAKWEEKAQGRAHEIADLMTNMLATFDAVKSAEQHIMEATGVHFDLIKKDFLDTAEQLLVAKVKSIIMGDLQFPDDQFKMLFIRHCLKSTGQTPTDILAKYLSTQEHEESPYGNLGVTRSLKDK